MEAQQASMRVINHKTMRKLIGATAILMPVAVWLLSKPELSAQGRSLTSISISYWTKIDDIFVGCLFAVAYFLFAYNGTGSCKRDSEYWLSKIACLSALFVALFPTCGFKTPASESNCSLEGAPNWIMAISFNHPHIFHYTATFLLFICLFFMLLIFSFRASRKGKNKRSMEYLAYGLGMIIGLPILYLVLDIVLGWADSLFYVEFLGLALFAAGWLRAGWYTEDREPKRPEGAEKFEPVEVDPSQKYYDTKIDIEPGSKYFFEAKGCWKDWIMSCGPDGWGPTWKMVTNNNRMPGHPFFLLCGTLGQNKDNNFCIGKGCSWEVPAGVSEKQRLYLFANDRDTDSAYENNKKLNSKQGGPLKVFIYKIK